MYFHLYIYQGDNPSGRNIFSENLLKVHILLHSRMKNSWRVETLGLSPEMVQEVEKKSPV